jgi:hypothetical protein
MFFFSFLPAEAGLSDPSKVLRLAQCRYSSIKIVKEAYAAYAFLPFGAKININLTLSIKGK